jgi:hypothetical protein
MNSAWQKSRDFAQFGVHGDADVLTAVTINNFIRKQRRFTRQLIREM